jgi:hypothetical protein
MKQCGKLLCLFRYNDAGLSQYTVMLGLTQAKGLGTGIARGLPTPGRRHIRLRMPLNRGIRVFTSTGVIKEDLKQLAV